MPPVISLAPCQWLKPRAQPQGLLENSSAAIFTLQPALLGVIFSLRFFSPSVLPKLAEFAVLDTREVIGKIQCREASYTLPDSWKRGPVLKKNLCAVSGRETDVCSRGLWARLWCLGLAGALLSGKQADVACRVPSKGVIWLWGKRVLWKFF